MEQLERKERFDVHESEIVFDQLVKKAPEETLSTIHGRAVLILPSHGTKDSFYSGSLDTLDYLNENGIKADIYSNDDDYKELVLHGEEIWLGAFFIRNFAISIFCNVVAAYIYERLKAKKDDMISVETIVERKDGHTSTVRFHGKVESLEKVFDAVRKFNNEI